MPGPIQSSAMEFAAAALICAGAVAGYRLGRMRNPVSTDIIHELRLLAVSVFLSTGVVMSLYLGFIAAWSRGFD